MSLADLIKKYLQKGDIEFTITREKMVEKLLNRKGKKPAEKPSAQIDNITKLLLLGKSHPAGYFSLDKIDHEYGAIITEELNKNPFVIDQNLASMAKTLTSSIEGDEAKAKTLYNWVEANVTYDKKNRIYRNSVEALNDKKGVCGSMAFLYIAMARSIGLKANFVVVNEDDSGKRVKHGCAAVELHGKNILVDPAYHKFDINHRRYEVVSDHTAAEMFESWR